MAVTTNVPSDNFDDWRRDGQDLTRFVNQNSGTVQTRTGDNLTPLPVRDQQFQQALANVGYTYKDPDTFTTGSTLNGPNEALRRASDGEYFRRVQGPYPYTVAPGTDPTLDPLYVAVGSAALADRLAATDSDVLIAGIVAEVVASVVSKFNIDAGRLQSVNITIGDQTISGATLRDAVVVARNINGPTDCHAFADRTVIQNATDAGTYGTFDSTAELRGNHTQEHIFSYQDRVIVNGDEGSVLNDSTGLHIDSLNIGLGTVVNRKGINVNDMACTSTGTVTNSIGIHIQPITQAENLNEALRIEQEDPATFAYFAPGGAAMHNKGKVGFGVAPSNNFAVRFSNGVGTENAFCATAANRAMFGAEGNSLVDVMSNGAVRLQVQQSGNTYNVTPGATNSQFLGQADKRWKGVFAGQITFTGIASADALNNSIFVDSADNLLKFKDPTGTVTAI